MKIAMIGSGAAGSVFACYLNKGGAELTLVDRYKAHMDKCSECGMTFVSPSGTEVLTGFKTAYSAENIGVQDIVILMVKATQTDGIFPSLMPCIGPETVVVSLQNGLGNDETLQKYVPAERILYGFGTIGTELPEPGKCVSKPESGVIMRFGAVKRSDASVKVGEYLEGCFNRGGCKTVFESPSYGKRQSPTAATTPSPLSPGSRSVNFSPVTTAASLLSPFGRKAVRSVLPQQELTFGPKCSTSCPV